LPLRPNQLLLLNFFSSIRVIIWYFFVYRQGFEITFIHAL